MSFWGEIKERSVANVPVIPFADLIGDAEALMELQRAAAGPASRTTSGVSNHVRRRGARFGDSQLALTLLP